MQVPGGIVHKTFLTSLQVIALLECFDRISA